MQKVDPVSVLSQVLSTMCSGEEEEEVEQRLLCQTEEQANIFLHSCCNIIFHFKTTLFQLIFKNPVASCHFGYFPK